MDRKKKIKDTIDRVKKLKDKVVGKPEIEGVKDPKKVKPKKDSKKKPTDQEGKKKKIRVTGPRGGVYFETPTGQRVYDSKVDRVKKSLTEYVQRSEAINALIQQFKKLRG